MGLFHSETRTQDHKASSRANGWSLAVGRDVMMEGGEFGNSQQFPRSANIAAGAAAAAVKVATP